MAPVCPWLLAFILGASPARSLCYKTFSGPMKPKPSLLVPNRHLRCSVK